MRAKVFSTSGKGLLAVLIVACFNIPVAAQMSDAVAVFNETLRKAQRLLKSNPGYRRQRQQEAKIAIPPPPVRSPLHTGAKTNTPQAHGLPSRPPKPKEPEKEAQPAALNLPAPAAATANAVAQPAATQSADRQPAQPPDVWSKEEIIAAQQACIEILARVDAAVERLEPIKNGLCGEPAPIKLIALKGNRTVRFKPAATLNCAMVQALETWVRRSLQPLARKHLGAPVATVSVMSSYSCRNAYGRKTTNLSEHSQANALDIGGFETTGGVRADLAADWGPTERDLIAAARAAEDRRATGTAAHHPAVSAQSAPTDPQPAAIGQIAAAQPQLAPLAPTPIGGAGQSAATVSLPPPLPQRRPSLRQRHEWAKAEREKKVAVQSESHRPESHRQEYANGLNGFQSSQQDLDDLQLKNDPKISHKISKSPVPKIDRAAFLREAHRTACRIFGTVLGPEANDAHRNHFHVDLAARKHENYCR